MKELGMFEFLKVLLKFRTFEAFDGTSQSFPACLTRNGVPIPYVLKLRSGGTARGIRVGIDAPFRREDATLDKIPTEDVVGWRPTVRDVLF
jgi:hypothetical protein